VSTTKPESGKLDSGKTASAPESIQVNLKNPALAAFLAWLWPGAGHLYQGRTAKGLLFMICILGTFFFGLWLGDGKVVYASWRPNDMRLAYLCQVGAGLPALPALVQARRVGMELEPYFGGRMAPPLLPDRNQGVDQLADWHKSLNRFFELGTVYTMVAGLLNILAIYDALDGPALTDEEREPGPADDDKRPPDPAGA
jgi:hypothetical protein